MFIPHDAPWLPEYLHELAMFPKGKFDDQVDSTSQALAYIGTPQPWDGWMEFIRMDTLRAYGLKPEDLTVTFDHITPDAEFELGYGRKIRREDDGFFHVSTHEWESFRGMHGVTLIDGAEW